MKPILLLFALIYITADYDKVNGFYVPEDYHSNYGNDDYGTNFGTDYGTNFGTDYGTDFGTDYGTDFGTDYGTDIGTDYGTDFGTNHGRDFGIDYGTEYEGNIRRDSGNNGRNNGNYGNRRYPSNTGRPRPPSTINQNRGDHELEYCARRNSDGRITVSMQGQVHENDLRRPMNQRRQNNY